MIKHLQSILDKQKNEQAFRELQAPRKDLHDFASNDYLGLACQAPTFQPQSLGSGGSRLICGNHEELTAFEHLAALHFQSESCLYFPSGYMANLGLFSCLLSRGDTYIYDQLAHASIRDGIRLSPAQAFGFEHNNLTALESKLKLAKGKKVIVVESIYSMDGDEPPIHEMVSLAQKYHAEIVVDEAHSTGLLGKKGSGWINQQGLTDHIFARIHTFGKAWGIHGAVVAGSETLKQYLSNFSRPLIYSTAPSPHELQTLMFSLKRIEEADEARSLLLKKIALFQSACRQLQIDHLLTSNSAIQGVIIHGNHNAKIGAETLRQKGFNVRAILSPTVAKGQERIRICLHSFNSDESILELTKHIKSLNA